MRDTGFICQQPGQYKITSAVVKFQLFDIILIILFYTVPAVVYPLENITVTEGENRTLTCNVSGSPSTLSVTWTEVKTGIRTMGITRELTHIDRNESGEYKCEASSSCGNDTKSTFVTVQCK